MCAILSDCGIHAGRSNGDFNWEVHLRARKTSLAKLLLSGHGPSALTRRVHIFFKWILFVILIFRIETTPKNADKSAAVADPAASFRPVCGSLFARLTRSPPAHICAPLSNDLSLIPDSRSARLSHFQAPCCLRNLPSRARTHSFCLLRRFRPFAALVCAAWHRRGFARAAVGRLC